MAVGGDAFTYLLTYRFGLIRAIPVVSVSRQPRPHEVYTRKVMGAEELLWRARFAPDAACKDADRR